VNTIKDNKNTMQQKNYVYASFSVEDRQRVMPVIEGLKMKGI